MFFKQINTVNFCLLFKGDERFGNLVEKKKKITTREYL